LAGDAIPEKLGFGKGARPKLLRSGKGCHTQETWV
jgi:hypothetical protein